MPETCISAFIEYLKFCLVKGFTGITNIKIERYISRKINLCGKTNFYNQYKGRTGKKANIDKITRSKQQQQHDIRLSMRGKKTCSSHGHVENMTLKVVLNYHESWCKIVEPRLGHVQNQSPRYVMQKSCFEKLVLLLRKDPQQSHSPKGFTFLQFQVYRSSN